MSYSINLFTHSGIAHMDDTLSVALMLAHHSDDVSMHVERVRQVPSGGQTSDYALDMNAPEDFNGVVLDHHYDGAKDCTAVQVLLDITCVSREDLFEALPWLKGVNTRDLHGIQTACREIGCTVKEYKEVYGAGNQFLVNLMTEEGEGVVSYDTLRVLNKFGKYVLKELGEYLIRRDAIAALHMKVVGGYKVADLRGQNLLAPFHMFSETEADICLMDNLRGEGVVMSRADRIGDRLDMGKFEEYSSFTHSGGFMCVLKEGVDPFDLLK